MNANLVNVHVLLEECDDGIPIRVYDDNRPVTPNYIETIQGENINQQEDLMDIDMEFATLGLPDLTNEEIEVLLDIGSPILAVDMTDIISESITLTRHERSDAKNPIVFETIPPESEPADNQPQQICSPMTTEVIRNHSLQDPRRKPATGPRPIYELKVITPSAYGTSALQENCNIHNTLRKRTGRKAHKRRLEKRKQQRKSVGLVRKGESEV